jgi:hypothetical protein
MSTTIYHFYIKRGDTEPPIKCILKDANGTVVDPSDGTVRFHMSKVRGRSITSLIDAPAAIENMTYEDATVKGVAYYWTTGDTDQTAGEYSAEWEYTDKDGGVWTFPNDSHNVVHITAQLA